MTGTFDADEGILADLTLWGVKAATTTPPEEF